MTSISFGVPITRSIEDDYTLDLAAGDQVYVSVADRLGDDFFPDARISSNSSVTVETFEGDGLLLFPEKLSFRFLHLKIPQLGFL